MSVTLHGNRVDNPGANYNGTDLAFSWWDWRMLAFYCFEVARDLCEASHHVCKWQSNDGHMTKDEAEHLGFVLQREIDSGRCKRYAQDYYRRLDGLPDVPCVLCNGTGKRSVTSGMLMTRAMFNRPKIDQGKLIECNGCDGYGARRPDECSYSFVVNHVQKLATFLAHCGGFEVT